jgi:hypothetical protein
VGDTLWDSGEVKSAETLSIEWGGRELPSRTAVRLKIMVVDDAGQACGWSEPIAFETGLLDASDWQAQWITKGGAMGNTTKTECQMFADEASPLFRYSWTEDYSGSRSSSPVSAAAAPSLVAARLYATGLGYYRMYVDGKRVGDGALEPMWTSFSTRVYYSTYNVTQALLAVSSAGGEHVLAAALGNGWWNPLPLKFWGHLNLRDGLATGEPQLIAQLELTYSDGTTATHASSAGGGWVVGRSATLTNNVYLGERFDGRLASAGWTRPGFDASHWSAAVLPLLPPPPPPPPPSKCSSKCTMLELPAGRYFSGRFNQSEHAGVKTLAGCKAACLAEQACLQLTWVARPQFPCVLYTEIEKTVVPVGGVQSWVKCVAGSEDAAKCAATNPDGPVPSGPATPGLLQAAPMVPVRKQPPLGPVVIAPGKPGAGNNPGAANSSGTVQIIDVGKNIAGVCSFTFRGGKAGDKVQIRYGELLHTADGSLNAMTSVAGQIKGGAPASECPGGNAPAIAFQEDTVFLSGSGEPQPFEPKFCWHAFRYAAVHMPAAVSLTADDVTCWPLRTDNPVVSSFDTSAAPMLGRIHDMVQRTFENNMMSIQSDCPHRERLGYGGDALASGEAGLSIFDLSTFYEKRVLDYSDARRPNGGFTETAPFVGMADAGMGGGSGPIGWQTFQPIAQVRARW